jgi:uncharacterized Fe-S radical SAM superfamily protein PflX
MALIGSLSGSQIPAQLLLSIILPFPHNTDDIPEVFTSSFFYLLSLNSLKLLNPLIFLPDKDYNSEKYNIDYQTVPSILTLIYLLTLF